MSDALIDSLIDAAINTDPSHQGLVKELSQAWISERVAPELLPYQDTLISNATNGLKAQIELIEEAVLDDTKTNFKLVILQTEIERVKYLLRAYLRTRIFKMDSYLLYCLHNPEVWIRLFPLERQYAQKHYAILERHYNNTFLRELPETGNLRKLDDKAAAGTSMVESPDLQQGVFIKVLENIGVQSLSATEQVNLETGNILLIRYQDIRHNLLKVCFLTSFMNISKLTSLEHDSADLSKLAALRAMTCKRPLFLSLIVRNTQDLCRRGLRAKAYRQTSHCDLLSF